MTALFPFFLSLNARTNQFIVVFFFLLLFIFSVARSFVIVVIIVSFLCLVAHSSARRHKCICIYWIPKQRLKSQSWINKTGIRKWMRKIYAKLIGAIQRPRVGGHVFPWFGIICATASCCWGLLPQAMYFGLIMCIALICVQLCLPCWLMSSHN